MLPIRFQNSTNGKQAVQEFPIKATSTRATTEQNAVRERHRLRHLRSLAGRQVEYQQLHDAYGHLKKAANESVIWLNRIAKYLEPLNGNQHLSADNLRANALIDALGGIFDVFEKSA